MRKERPSLVDSSKGLLLAHVERPIRDEIHVLSGAIDTLSDAKDKLQLKPKECVGEVVDSVKVSGITRKVTNVASTMHGLYVRGEIHRGYEKRIKGLREEIKKKDKDPDMLLKEEHVSAVVDRLREARKRPEVHEFYDRVIENAGKLPDKTLSDRLSEQRDLPAEDLYLMTVPEPFSPYPNPLPKDTPILGKHDSLFTKVVADTALALMDTPQREPVLITGSNTAIQSSRLVEGRYIEQRSVRPEIREHLRVPKSDLRVVRDVYTLLGLHDKASEVTDTAILDALSHFGGEEQRRHTLRSLNVHTTFIFAGDRGSDASYIPPHVSLEVAKFKPIKESPLPPDLSRLRDVTIYKPK